MSHIVLLEKVNQFLPEDKLTISEHADVQDLEETAYNIVSGKLSSKYDTATWGAVPVAPAEETRPSLVVSIIGMLTAGYAYNRLFAEDTVAGSVTYGDKLIANALSLIDEILEDTLHLLDADLITSTTGSPDYLETEPVFGMGTAY